MHLTMGEKKNKVLTQYESDQDDEEVCQINSQRPSAHVKVLEDADDCSMVMYNGLPVNAQVFMDDDLDDRSSVNSEELTNNTSYIPIKRKSSDASSDGTSPLNSSQTQRSLNVPTPVNLNLRDIVNPLDDWTHSQQNIKEKKYPVLPSIGGTVSNHLGTLDSPKPIHVMDNGTLNQLDYTREKMENEADFFADYRINTSLVKVTPRHNPLPPIKQTSSVGSVSSKR